MKVRVYKSLDKKSSLFGIQGSYLYLIVGGVVIAIVIGFGVVGAAVGSSFVGTAATLVLAAVAYFIVMTIQGNFSERELTRKMTSFKIPDYILIRRKPSMDVVRSRREFTQKNKKKKTEDQ